MATNILTGRDIALTYATVNYDDQIIGATVTFDDPVAVVETLNGKAFYTVDKETGSIAMEILQDWGKTPSLCDTLWGAADSTPTTTATVTATINAKVMTLTVLPKRPDFGGTAPDALTTTVTMPITGISYA